jgi:hypothetical protein
MAHFSLNSFAWPEPPTCAGSRHGRERARQSSGFPLVIDFFLFPSLLSCLRVQRWTQGQVWPRVHGVRVSFGRCAAIRQQLQLQDGCDDPQTGYAPWLLVFWEKSNFCDLVWCRVSFNATLSSVRCACIGNFLHLAVKVNGCVLEELKRIIEDSEIMKCVPKLFALLLPPHPRLSTIGFPVFARVVW